METNQKSEIVETETLEGTARIEAFSDGVVAIIVTILILEIHVPELLEYTNSAAWDAFSHILPKLVAFFISFVTVAIFWVNHHHFFHPLKKSDSAMLWHNNHLLFWLSVVPFVTAFAGNYPSIPFVVALYGFVLFMAAFAFTLMIRYVYFKTNLYPENTTKESRMIHYKRSWPGTFLYGISIPLAFVHPYIAIAIFLILPVFYFIPQRVE
jgi:uncharacterized membrane protein